jgi:hypothetical protein
LVLVLLGASIPVAGSQEDDQLVSIAAASVATDVINGTVLVTQSIDTGAEVHTLALVRVDRAIEGDLSGDVFVEVPGGAADGGVEVIVSHQPRLRVGDSLQLALVLAPSDEAMALAGTPSVYSIVGGIDGAAAVSGSMVSQANASGDFRLTGSRWDPSDSSRWPIPYRINTQSAGLSSADAVAALRAGLQEWQDDPFSDIEFSYEGTTSASPSNYNDGSNTIGWVDTPNSADQFLAQAVWVSASGNTLAFDVRFNRDYSWSWGREPGRFDVETVNLHEGGHVIGLGHTTASTAEVMYPSISSNTTKGLGTGDLSGAASLYPAADPPPALPTGPTVEPFIDVPQGTYFSDAVAWAYAEGITTGTSSNRFSPGSVIDRGQFALLLYRYSERPPPSSAQSLPFADVPASGELRSAIAWLHEQGVTTGTTATTYSPEQGLSRGQIATLLWRHSGSPGQAVPSDPFLDVVRTAYYGEAVTWAWSRGLTTGTTPTTYAPSDRLTRAQAITFLYRLAGEPSVD